ncbi:MULTISPECIES: WxL domain-containing protein [unclassified Lactobacillus]|uniref:WxL domain-containing protein n=1 Tax=unclassified Lactobacillus TaxID=2620435 RepID=UPI000EFBC30A|nr:MULTISPECIES: WxL domain-containing protein [unclassified Lactobacillus]RMC24561.1 cell surface protein [Lactobacillus sp. ESL0247]RMC28700.1 cell surface protein [Lactobacillus sp. ESL0246]RMC31892.1 cell surface protein [Lactobacillus sp. ESL0245]
MKLTKIASLVMTSATVLSSVAAVTPAITQAKTQEGNAKMNGGKALPDSNHSTVGIGFSQDQDAKPNPNPDNPNKPDDGVGYLRLQYVPAVLDFGSHTKFDPATPIFTAAGMNLNSTGNDVHPGYAGADNQTPKLSTTDPDLDNVKGKTWVTVIDKQRDRTDTDDKSDSHSGDWQLSVKADGPLTTGSGASAKTITGAKLAFNNTAAGHTANVFGLTGNNADKNFSNDVTWLADNVIKNLTVNLAADSTAVQVATAKATTGSGAEVFAWDPKDIQLSLPTDANIAAGTYTTSLTWTLSTGIK